MKKNDTTGYIYFPSDLTTFMASPFASWMEHAAQEAFAFKALKNKSDALSQSLQQKSCAHEAQVYDTLVADGSNASVNIATLVTSLKQSETALVEAQTKATLDAMTQGVDIIYQGCLAFEDFRGVADLLIKVPGQSNLGDYHYEVWSTTRTKRIKPYCLIQLCCYAQMLEQVQGVRPRKVSLVLGTNERVDFLVEDYFYAYLALKQRFLNLHQTFDLTRPADPADSKQWGDWIDYAQQLLIERDHLIQVANITRAQIITLEAAGIHTLTALATTDLSSVAKMNPERFSALKRQATMQRKTQQQQRLEVERPAFEVVLPSVSKSSDEPVPQGLARLPPASAMDLFFDIEGDPLHEQGLEYLWGASYFTEQGERAFIDFWAHTHEQEKQAFKGFIEWAYARWQADPMMHIYHYGHYEIAACRRLMGRYAVCEQQVDELLRNEVFVDLYAIVRHGIILGEPRYSIKNVERLYRGKRQTDVASGGDSVVVYEAWRDNPDGFTWQTSAVLKKIRDYNQDDCDSTQELVDWLRTVQAEHDIAYFDLEALDALSAACNTELLTTELTTELSKRPATEPTQAELDKIEREAHRLAVHDALLDRSRQLHSTNPDEANISALLAHLLFFHHRETKPVWWKLFDRLSQDEQTLFEEIDCLANAQRTLTKAFKQKESDRNFCYEYQMDLSQEFKVPHIGQSGKRFYLQATELLAVTMVQFNQETGRFLIKAKNEPGNSVTLIPDEYVNPDPIPATVLSLAEAYLQNPEHPNAFLDFLRRDTERHQSALLKIAQAQESKEKLLEIVTLLVGMDHGFLTIQGPPGTGKSYTAKHLIVALAMAGMRIGISSNSHKAIFNLLESIAGYARELGLEIPLYHSNQRDAEQGEQLGIELLNNREIADVLALHDANSPGLVVGTTAWGFARNDVAQGFDYLFVDEAGQVSLANLAAMSQASNNLVLLGDQMQLGQPIQGTHPQESGASVLEYLLGDQQTIPETQGVFLGVTYRMHPDVNAFISQAFYNSRLQSAPECARQKVLFKVPLITPTTTPTTLPTESSHKITQSTGLVYVPVAHQGNRQSSLEEAEEIVRLTEALIGQTFVNQAGEERIITLDDILFIAPYNHQVSTLKRLLDKLDKVGKGAKVGSVDLFQGQEAPIVMLSMCTSDASDSPRGIDFLLNPNRLNVALSRAQALAIVVASPTLVEMDLTSERHLKRVNQFEWLKQCSTTVA